MYLFSILTTCYSELYRFRIVLLTHHFCTALMLLSISTINNFIRNVFNFPNFSLNTLFSITQCQHWGRLLLSKCAIQFKMVSLTDIDVYLYLLISEA